MSNTGEVSNFKITIHNNIQDNELFVIPIPINDELHYIQNTYLFYFIYEINTKQRYFIKDKTLFLDKIIYTLDKRSLLHHIQCKYIFDVNIHRYLNNLPLITTDEYYTSAHLFFHRKYYNTEFKNIIIPLEKWYESCVNILIKNKITFDFDKDNTYLWYNDRVSNILYEIEKNGLCIDTNKLDQHFTNIRSKSWDITNLIYSYYNIFTSTGRPSNAYGGLNFAALNTQTGCRETFISRYGNEGTLIEFDYSAFHVRIIADILKYKFEFDEDIHVHFAKQYFDTAEVTEEQYNESKKITFQKLYGGIKTNDNKFFRLVRDLSTEIHNEYKKNKYIQSFISKRKVYIDDDNASQYKIFNYFIQLHEMEYVMSILHNLLPFLHTNYNDIKLVLYTYDGLLFDFKKNDMLQENIKTISNILSHNSTFPVKSYIGNNYNEMTEFVVN